MTIKNSLKEKGRKALDWIDGRLFNSTFTTDRLLKTLAAQEREGGKNSVSTCTADLKRMRELAKYNLNPDNFEPVNFRSSYDDGYPLSTAVLRTDGKRGPWQYPIVKQAILPFKGAYVLLSDYGFPEGSCLPSNHRGTLIFGILEGPIPPIHKILTWASNEEREEGETGDILERHEIAGDYRSLYRLIENSNDKESLEQAARDLEFRPPYSYPGPRVIKGSMFR